MPQLISLQRESLFSLLQALSPIDGRASPFPQPWHQMAFGIPLPWSPGPGPQPWYAIGIADVLIERLATQHSTGHGDFAVASQTFESFIDEWCGSVPRRRFPIPPPRGIDFSEVDKSPAALLLAAANFQRVADTLAEGDFKLALTKASEKLLMQGMERLTIASR